MGERPKPENILLLMIVLGIMFIGICIAMNLFSRARFKKRSANAFVVAGRTTPQSRRLPRSAAPSRQSQRSMSGHVDPSTLPAQMYCQSPLRLPIQQQQQQNYHRESQSDSVQQHRVATPQPIESTVSMAGSTFAEVV